MLKIYVILHLDRKNARLDRRRAAEKSEGFFPRLTVIGITPEIGVKPHFQVDRLAVIQIEESVTLHFRVISGNLFHAAFTVGVTVGTAQIVNRAILHRIYLLCFCTLIIAQEIRFVKTFFLAPLNRGKITGTNAVCFFKIKCYGEKAVILTESGGVSADVFSPEITFHSLGGQLSAIVNSVNHAGGDIQLFILPQLGLDADEDGLGGGANLGTNQIAVTVKEAEQVTLLFGFI